MQIHWLDLTASSEISITIFLTLCPLTPNSLNNDTTDFTTNPLHPTSTGQILTFHRRCSASAPNSTYQNFSFHMLLLLSPPKEQNIVKNLQYKIGYIQFKNLRYSETAYGNILILIHMHTPIVLDSQNSQDTLVLPIQIIKSCDTFNSGCKTQIRGLNPFNRITMMLTKT